MANGNGKVFKWWEVVLLTGVLLWCFGLSLMVVDVTQRVLNLQNNRTASDDQIKLMGANEARLDKLEERERELKSRIRELEKQVHTHQQVEHQEYIY